MDLKQHLLRQMAFSHATYGPGPRTEGVIDHIRRELVEVEESGGSPSEWVDVVILALDGLTRAVIFADETRGDPDDAAGFVCRRIVAKQAKNEARVWPDWRTAAPGKAIEHDRSHDAPTNARDLWFQPQHNPSEGDDLYDIILEASPGYWRPFELVNLADEHAWFVKMPIGDDEGFIEDWEERRFASKEAAEKFVADLHEGWTPADEEGA